MPRRQQSGSSAVPSAWCPEGPVSAVRRINAVCRYPPISAGDLPDRPARLRRKALCQRGAGRQWRWRGRLRHRRTRDRNAVALSPGRVIETVALCSRRSPPVRFQPDCPPSLHRPLVCLPSCLYAEDRTAPDLSAIVGVRCPIGADSVVERRTGNDPVRLPACPKHRSTVRFRGPFDAQPDDGHSCLIGPFVPLVVA
jgi:hypothetical protein